MGKKSNSHAFIGEMIKQDLKNVLSVLVSGFLIMLGIH